MYYVLHAVSKLLSFLNKNQLDRLAKGLSCLLFSVLRLRRKLILQNLRTAFAREKSETEIQTLAWQSVYHFILTMLEFLAERHGRLGEKVLIAAGEEYLQEAKKLGQGVYILCIHLGSWEAMGSALTNKGYESHVIVKKVGSAGVDRFVSELRQKNGFYSISRRKKGDAFAGIKKILANNKIVGFVMDQARPREPSLPFFGKNAKTNTSFAAIWRQLPAPIIPAYIKRIAVGEHHIYVKPPLQLQLTNDNEKDVLQHSLEFNRVVEAMIRECPEQYFWMHNRWKD